MWPDRESDYDRQRLDYKCPFLASCLELIVNRKVPAHNRRSLRGQAAAGKRAGTLRVKTHFYSKRSKSRRSSRSVRYT